METLTINTIQSSFEQLKPVGTRTATYFYRKLVEFDPDVKNKYTGATSILSLANDFMSFLSTVVSNLNNYKKLKPVLKNLGQLFALNNVKPTFYDFMGTAFMATLAKNLKEKYTLEVQLAWLSFFKTITHTMRSANI